MSTVDGVKNKKPISPRSTPPLEAPKSDSKGKKAGPVDSSQISKESRKPEPTGERKDLLDGLKSNYGGEGRLRSNESKLDKLSTDDLKDVKRKRDFDKALTKHEEDHHEVAADLARSGPLYETEIGADGQEYRKSGKVMIDTSIEKDDEKTVEKMKQVKAAALAPEGNQLAPLSDQDKKVAGEATENLRKAEARLEAKSNGTEVPEFAKIQDGDFEKGKNKGG